MNEPHSDRPDDSPMGDDLPLSDDSPIGDIDPKIRIRHELVRVRRQAEAARLEANAARLEASAEHLEELIERIDAGEVLSESDLTPLGLSRQKPAPAHRVESVASPGSTEFETSTPQSATVPLPRFDSWDAIRKARAAYGGGPRADAVSRVDSAHHAIRRPRMKPAFPSTDHSETDDSQESDDSNILQDATSVAPVIEPVNERAMAPGSETPIEIVADPGEDESGPTRRHPMALVVSAVIHFLILFVLAGFTLSNAMPKDQVSLSASTSESNESAMETFQIEAVEPMTDPTETTSDETQYDVSPLGEMAQVDVTSDVVAAVTQPMASMTSLSQPNLNSSSALKALKSDSQSKMEFCGVEGGGNHFVYLVDSSGSMGDAFVSARRALLDSIEMLTPQQRFYVIFFDTNCDYMRITRADQDEPRSVYATPDNKARLKAWAMRVSMDRGQAPYEPLEYALETLKPDVIFLLSDGEFPAKIEELVKEKNLVTNLFGDESPVSIIHTISYYSREGESRMRRIAEQNHGQYRHVPKPKSR